MSRGFLEVQWIYITYLDGRRGSGETDTKIVVRWNWNDSLDNFWRLLPESKARKVRFVDNCGDLPTKRVGVTVHGNESVSWPNYGTHFTSSVVSRKSVQSKVDWKIPSGTTKSPKQINQLRTWDPSYQLQFWRPTGVGRRTTRQPSSE